MHIFTLAMLALTFLAPFTSAQGWAITDLVIAPYCSLSSAQIIPPLTNPDVQSVLIGPKPRSLVKLRINEVQFDPLGQDGGNEWIELYNASSSPINVKGVRLKDNKNATLAVLPNLNVPGKKHYVVHLGPLVPETADNDFSDGEANVFTGAAPGDYLSNTFGGVHVVYAGKSYDAVFWGTGSGPRGAGYDAAVAAGRWSAGDYVELAYTSGHMIVEGSTLGRDIDSRDTDASGDFLLSGGPNGAFPTPGTRNGMFVFSESSAIHWTQAVVQELTGIIGSANQMGLSVTSASHANVVVTDPDLTGGFTLQADHAIDVDYQGAAKTLVGSLTFDYARDGTAGATSYDASVSGTLTSLDSSVSLSFSYSKSEDGFHALARTLTCVTAFTWTEFGQPYDYSATNVVVTTQTGQGTWSTADNRSWSDWGTLSKVSTSTQTRTKLGDGQYAHQATQVQTAPSPPPSFGETQYDYGVVTLDYESTETLDADFGVSKSITKMDKEWVDPFGYSLSKGELVSPASYTVARTAGTPLSPLGSFEVRMDMTLRFGYPDPDPFDRGQSYSVTDQLTRAIVGGEFIESGTISGPTGSMSYFIDAPVARAPQGCGCGCGGANCTCGGTDEDDGLSGGDVAGIATGVGAAAGVCTWGTIVTTPVAITGVGALVPAGIAGTCAAAGAVWWLTWEWWHD